MVLNKAVNSAVKAFVSDISRSIQEKNFLLDIDIDWAEADDGKCSKAESAIISTEFGSVVVVPDFKKKGARACIIDLGRINCLQQEGFSEEFIETKGHIYRPLKMYSKKNVDYFAYYLSQKLDVKTINTKMDQNS